MAIHSESRITPEIREEIHSSKGLMTIDAAARHFNVSRGTIIKWRKRNQFNDRSHRPHQLHTALSADQEDIVVILRRLLLLPLDDLLVVTRQLIFPTLSRSSLIRLLKRHKVNSLNVLYTELSEETPVKKLKKFKDDEPGCIHVDIKYLPMMPDDPQKRYLLIAVDRATRWVYLEVTHDKTADTAATFIKRGYAKCPVTIRTVITDTGKEFTDRFNTHGEHVFGKTCSALKIEHRLAAPKPPQTAGMMKCFNDERIPQIIKLTHFRSAKEMITTLTRCNKIYNHYIVQQSLGGLTPVKAMDVWRKEHS